MTAPQAISGTPPDPSGQESPSVVVTAATAKRLVLRRVVSLGDQVLSGASNFLTVALVARSTSPEGFGHFALAYAVLLALLSLGHTDHVGRVAERFPRRR